MTKKSAQKKAARRYQAEHPGTTFPDAMRAVERPTLPHSVSEVVSKAEFLELVRRLTVLGEARNRAFIGFDESIRLQSERRWAAHIRSAAVEVGMHDLAGRIDPQRFASGSFENIMAIGRIRTDSQDAAGRIVLASPPNV